MTELFPIPGHLNHRQYVRRPPVLIAVTADDWTAWAPSGLTTPHCTSPPTAKHWWRSILRSRSTWRKKRDDTTVEERTVTNPAGNTYTYELPFRFLDRQADMRAASAQFAERSDISFCQTRSL